MRSTTVWLQ